MKIPIRGFPINGHTAEISAAGVIRCVDTASRVDKKISIGVESGGDSLREVSLKRDQTRMGFFPKMRRGKMLDERRMRYRGYIAKPATPAAALEKSD